LSVLRIPTAEVFEPLLQPSRYKGAYGGRGSAKSHHFAGQVVEESIADRLDFVCIREVQRTLDQSVKKLLETKIAAFNVGEHFDVQDRRIKTRKGGVIIFEGMQNHTAESIKSLEGYDRAWVEEAQTLSQRSLDMLRPTIRKPDSELWFSWNPRSLEDPVDKFLRADPPPGAIVVQANYTDNPWFPEVLQKEMEYDRSRDAEKYAHIWLGKYETHSEARVFKNWKVEEFERPPGTIHRLGADFGFSIDPAVMVRCSIDGNRLYVDYEAYMIGCEIVNLPELFMAIPEAEKWPSTADSARPETISHLNKHGFPKMRRAIKGAKSVDEGVAFLQSFDIIVHPRCTHVIDELTHYRYRTDPLTSEVLPLLEDKNNHCIDALRYARERKRDGHPTAFPQRLDGIDNLWPTLPPKKKAARRPRTV
jgi:phage terminase large subunit